MITAGVSIIDVGGESTRPGAPDVSLEEELQRVVPVVKAIREKYDVWISVDTSKAEVMRQAIAVGADLINDIRALQEPGALQVAAASKLPVCLMHMKGQPRTMQESPQYENLMDDVAQFLEERIAACEAVGINKSQLISILVLALAKPLNTIIICSLISRSFMSSVCLSWRACLVNQ